MCVCCGGGDSFSVTKETIPRGSPDVHMWYLPWGSDGVHIRDQRRMTTVSTGFLPPLTHHLLSICKNFMNGNRTWNLHNFFFFLHQY